MSNPETDKVKVRVMDDRDKSYLFEEMRDDGMPPKRDFFPKSEVTFDRRNVKTGEAVAIIPLWLLERKGWDE